MKERHLILGVHLQDRIKDAAKVQQLLTEYGCNIKTRVGLHEVDESFCAKGGVLLLEMFGDDATCHALRDKLSAIADVEVQQMVFEHVA
jgi:hypothetical protein